jgi:hypothetical protein
MTTVIRKSVTRALLLLATPFGVTSADDRPSSGDAAVWENTLRQVARGRNAFRFDTFGDEDF